MRSDTPTLTTGGATNNGTIYGGTAQDGSASGFVFGGTSAFDSQYDFDGRFGLNYEPSFPAAGVAVYKFKNLKITGGPVYQQLGGPVDIALISAGTVTAASPGGIFSVNGLDSLTIASQTGALDLGTKLTIDAAAGSSFRFLHLYARASTAALGGVVNLPTANLFIDAQSNLTLNLGGTYTFDRGLLNSGGNVSLGGTISANSLQVYAAGGVTLNNGLALPRIDLFAANLVAKADVQTTAGILTINGGGISAAGRTLAGFERIDVSGSVLAASVSTSGPLTIGGAITFDSSLSSQIFEAASFRVAGGIDFSGSDAGLLLSAPTGGGTLTLLGGSVLFDSANGIASANFNGGSAAGLLNISAGGNGGTLDVGTVAQPIANDITVNTPITATTGPNNLLGSGGTGGTVGMVANGTIGVNNTVKVSESAGAATSRSGGTINLESRKTSGTAISISSSAQLLALLSNAAAGPSGKITITSSGGDIAINGATVRADRGTVDIRNNGNAGAVNLANANLNGSVVKAGALGANGTLNVGGGTITADSQIKLYAGGSNGRVNFTENVTLNGNSVKTIAADAVTIFNGKVVTVNGPTAANVFTNQPNYSGSGGNASTSGVFAGKGANTQPLSSAPGF